MTQTRLTLDELEKLAAHIVARTGDTEVAVIPYLVKRLRATEALIEKAFDEGHLAGHNGDPYGEAWSASDTKAALDRLREGADA